MRELPNPFMDLGSTQRAAIDAKIAEVEKVLKSFKRVVTKRLPKPAKKTKSRKK